MGIKMKLRGLFASALLAVTMAAPTQGFAITNVLYLTMDGSGSISPTEWDIQVDGYVGALQAVVDSSFYNNLAIGVSVYGRDVKELTALSTITSLADLTAITDAIQAIETGGSGIDRNGVNTGATATGDAIFAAQTAINNFGLGVNNVIDVSTDGQTNIGISDDDAADAALANVGFPVGITTNCLAIGSGARCGFETGFAETASTFNDFQAVLIRKLQRELGVPEPGIAALMAMGLLGIGFVRRRKA